MPSQDHGRVIIHMDIDAFYAQVEEIAQPELKSKPLGVYQKTALFEHCTQRPEAQPPSFEKRVQWKGLSDKNSEWLAVLAKQHNREQHAANGNTLVFPDGMTFVDRLQQAIKDFHAPPTQGELTSTNPTAAALLYEMTDEFIQTDRTASATLSLAGELFGTCHQYRGVVREPVAVPEPDPASNAPDAALVQELADVAYNLRNRQVRDDVGLWYGIGVTLKYTGPPLTETTTNTRLLDTVMRDAKFASRDWRLPALKVALYDQLRERVITAPAGVPYDFPAHQPPVTFINTRNGMDKWEYQAVFVTPAYFERATQRGTLVIDGVNYDPWSEAIVTIVLHPMSALKMGLKTIAALNYPLAITYEVYQMVVGNRHVEYTRNASSVSIADDRRLIVFVVTSASGQQITIGGLNVILNDAGAANPLPPLKALPFDGPLTNILQTVLQSNINLRTEWDDIVSGYSGGTCIDWGVISKILSQVIPRFPPQPETTRVGGIGGVALKVDNLHCPPLFVNTNPNAADFAAVVAAAQLPAAHAGYHHAAVVNSFDAVTAPRNIADQYPVMRVGMWSNAAELLTGLNIMVLTLPQTLCRDTRLEGTRGYLRRGRCARIACELTKGLTGLGNAPDGIADPAIKIDGGKWQREVCGAELSLVSYASQLVSGSGSSVDIVYSLAVNVRREGYKGTVTGSRVPAAVAIGTDNISMAPITKFSDLYTLWNDRSIDVNIRSAYVPNNHVFDTEVDRLLGRIDLTSVVTVHPFLLTTTRAAIPIAESILPGRIHSGFLEALARAGGWGGKIRQQGAFSNLFGWGIKAVLRDWPGTRDLFIPLAHEFIRLFLNPFYGGGLQFITVYQQ